MLIVFDVVHGIFQRLGQLLFPILLQLVALLILLSKMTHSSPPLLAVGLKFGEFPRVSSLRPSAGISSATNSMFEGNVLDSPPFHTDLGVEHRRLPHSPCRTVPSDVRSHWSRLRFHREHSSEPPPRKSPVCKDCKESSRKNAR